MHVGTKQLAMRILAVDPGFDRLGLAVLEGDASNPILVWSTCVEPARGKPQERLAIVFSSISEAIETYKPELLAIETLFFSTNRSGSALPLGFWLDRVFFTNLT